MNAADLVAAAPPHPRRVVCLTEETTETLYRIGAGDLVVGVSGFTVRPPEARRKPRVSSFLGADADAIVALRPDLVLGFSDLQADIARDLVRRGVPVLVRTSAPSRRSSRRCASYGARSGAAEAGAGSPRALHGAGPPRGRGGGAPRDGRARSSRSGRIRSSRASAGSRSCSSCAAPTTSAGEPGAHAAAGRVFEPAEVARRAPEVIVASWCGKKAAARRSRLARASPRRRRCGGPALRGEERDHPAARPRRAHRRRRGARGDRGGGRARRAVALGGARGAPVRRAVARRATAATARGLPSGPAPTRGGRRASPSPSWRRAGRTGDPARRRRSRRAGRSPRRGRSHAQLDRDEAELLGRAGARGEAAVLTNATALWFHGA